MGDSTGAMSEAERTPRAFSLPGQAARLAASGERWQAFIDCGTMEVGIYALGAGEEDPQQPHEFDEVYCVIEGRALLRIEGRDYSADPGAVLFVPAGANHQFVEIREDLLTLVFFSKAAPRQAAR